VADRSRLQLTSTDLIKVLLMSSMIALWAFLTWLLISLKSLQII
jgi:hypothetical protein